jgi:hypothetical protein
VKPVALRTALIWHDEVMNDVVIEKPRKITLGATGRSTFVVPDLELPAEFAIVRPGKRGYLLTLGEHMRGTICIDGQERDVADLLRKEGSGGFCATPISGRDWGVIDLDASGDYKLFFQFVPLEEEEPTFFTPKVIMAGIGGYLLASLGVALIWWLQGYAIDESLFRGFLKSTLALGVAAVIWKIVQVDNESKLSLLFSIVLHGVLLIVTFFLADDHNPFVWPGPRSLSGDYLVTRIDPEPEPPPKATIGAKTPEAAAKKSETKKNLKTATKGDEGKSGGEGETERARSKAPEEALLTPQNQNEIEKVVASQIKFDVDKYGSMGFGKSKGGTGVGNNGPGTGTTRGSTKGGRGGGGNVEGDFESNKGKIDTGKDRPGGTCVGPNCTGAAPKEIKVAIADPTGDFGGYTEDEINRVVKARAGVFRACYQKELNRSPGLGGKLVIKFKIGADGAVATAANAGGGSLSNAEVESCVKGNVMRLRFPPKGAIANVTYPFVFSQGG